VAEISRDGHSHFKYNGSFLKAANLVSFAGCRTNDVRTSNPIAIKLLAHQSEEGCVHCIQGMDDPTSLNAFKCLHKMVIKITPVEEEVGVGFCDE
jgi:hypothetical protein